MRINVLAPGLFSMALIMFFTACETSSEKSETAKEVNLDFPYTSQSEDALVHLKEGLFALDLGYNQVARSHFDEAIEADPDFAAAYVYRSFTSRSPQEFATDVKTATEKNANLSDAEQLLVELDNAFLTGNQDKELSVVKSMVEKYPDIARGHTTLGQTHESLNDVASARSSYKKAIELNPDWIGGYSSLGNSYIFSEPKDLAKAEENMKKGVELLPNESGTHIALGDVYRAQQNLDKALASYKKAAELNSKDPVAYSKAGHVSSFLGNYDEARESFEKAGSLSDVPTAHLAFVAYTWLYAGDHAKGLSWLKEEAMKLDGSGLPEDRILAAKNNLLRDCFMIAYHMGDVNELKALDETIQPLDLKNTESAGSAEAMMQYNARMNRRSVLIAIVEGDLALAKEKAGAHKEALAGISSPTKLEPYNFLKGEIAMKEGMYADAVNYFEKADLDGMYPKYKLAMAVKAAGDEARANQLLEEVSTFNFNTLGYALVRNEVKAMLSPA